MNDLRLRNASSWTIFIFGILAFALGVVGILSPETLLSLMNFEIIERPARLTGDYTLTFMTASAMASFNMGAYYVLASLTNWKAFYLWTVPFRCVTFTVFTLAVLGGVAPQGFIGVAVWELIGAIATGIALYRERQVG
jgi:hypothetical protein